MSKDVGNARAAHSCIDLLMQSSAHMQTLFQQPRSSVRQDHHVSVQQLACFPAEHHKSPSSDQDQLVHQLDSECEVSGVYQRHE